MKKLLFVMVSLLLMLVGCSSTNPSLKEVYMNSMKYESFESKMTLSVNADVKGAELEEQEKQILDMLKSGITMEQKQANAEEAYMKLTLVNDQPLRDMGYWSAEEQAALEILVKGQKVFMKTSADPYYYEVDTTEAEGYNASAMQMSMADQKKLREFMKGALEDYMMQFDYTIENINDKGWKNIQTPEGYEKVRMVEVQFDINNILDFASYTLGNLAEYEKLDQLVKDFMAFMPEEAGMPSDEELTEGIQEVRNGMLQAKAYVDGFTEESLEEMAGMDIDFKAVSEVGLSKEKKYLASEDTTISLSVTDRESGEGVDAEINIDSLVWNVGGQVDLPKVQRAINVEELAQDLDRVKALPDETPVKQLLMKEFSAEFIVNETFATLGTEWVELPQATYEKNGEVMVPIANVTDWLNGKLKWNGKDQSFKVQIGKKNMDFKVGSKEVKVNGKKLMMTSPVELKNGTSFVPVSFIAEQIGAKVDYNKEYGTVNVYFE
ncbi:copper amine oxidase N-terminal domain-containing protein [Bacillus tianshenii]|nr:copper amine oxidase N-terminal domain-containing protein [Bacillus tianshenii]